MHVLVLLTDLFNAIGGIQTFNRCLVKALGEIADKKDLTLTVIVLNDKEPTLLAKNYFNYNKIQYFLCKGSKFKFIVLTLFQFFKASKIIFGHVNFVPLAIAKLFSPKSEIFLIVYGIEVCRSLSVLQTLSIKRFNKIISISHNTRDEMISYNSLNKTMFDILPCTLEPIFSNNTGFKSKEELLLPQGQILLTVARLDIPMRGKNIDLVIKSMPLVLSRIPDAYYVVVGSGPDKKRLEELANNVGVDKKVIFAGQVTNDLLPSYYHHCDAFVMPAFNEGFGIVFLEAMYHAKPCIGAQSGGVPEIIEDGKTGFLVDPESVESLTHSIISLLGDKNLSNAMGKAGQVRAENKFSFNGFRNKLETILSI